MNRDDRRRHATEAIREMASKAKPLEARMLAKAAYERGAISRREFESAVVDGRGNSEIMSKVVADVARRDDAKEG